MAITAEFIIVLGSMLLGGGGGGGGRELESLTAIRILICQVGIQDYISISQLIKLKS